MVVFLVVCACFICFLFGGSYGMGIMRREAVERGHAEFYRDEYGHQKWRWRPPADEPGKKMPDLPTSD